MDHGSQRMRSRCPSRESQAVKFRENPHFSKHLARDFKTPMVWEVQDVIWVNYNISLTWIKAIWGWFPWLSMIPVRSQWGRYKLPRCYGQTICFPLCFGWIRHVLAPPCRRTFAFAKSPEIRSDGDMADGGPCRIWIYIYIYLVATTKCSYYSTLW